MTNEQRLIMGKVAKSINEYNTSVALDELLELKVISAWYYEVPLRGGAGGVAGGLSIDFLVYDPHPRPLECMDQHWHSGQMGSNDHYRIAVIRSVYRREPDILWSPMTKTLEKARESVRDLYAN